VVNFSIKINYSIENNLLVTELVHPTEFLLLAAQDQLVILDGIVKLTKESALPDDFILDGTVEENHDIMIQEARMIFPLSMSLVVKEVGEGVLNVDFNYGKKVDSIHHMHLFIMIDGLIKSINASLLVLISSIKK